LGGEASGEPTTAWGRAVAGIRPDGTVPLDTALAAFSVAFGPLPGVEPLQGDPEVIGSASGPTRWILNYWDELTPDQQAAVDRYLAVDGLTSVRTDPVAALNPLTAAVLDESGFQRLANEMEAKVSEKLSRTLGVPIEVVLRDLEPSEAGETLFANTIPLDAAGKPARASTPKMASCQVQVGKATQILEGVVDQEAILAHEVFHCFQYSLAKKLADALAMPAWLAEGAGAWVGEEVAAGGSTIGNKYWLGWMATPTRARTRPSGSSPTSRPPASTSGAVSTRCSSPRSERAPTPTSSRLAGIRAGSPSTRGGRATSATRGSAGPGSWTGPASHLDRSPRSSVTRWASSISTP
jgi:hypothetical protein